MFGEFLQVESCHIAFMETGFDSRTQRLGDPVICTQLYFCGGVSDEQIEKIMKRGFSKEDFTRGPYGKGLYFSMQASQAAAFSAPGKLLLCNVGLGLTESVVVQDRGRTLPPPGYDSILTGGRPQSPVTPGPPQQEYVVFDPLQNNNQCVESKRRSDPIKMTSLSPSSLDPSQLLPREAREQFRKNNLTHISCSQFCAVSRERSRCHHLASDSDVRTDLPLYAVSEDGIVSRHVDNVLEIPWEGMVTFYFGCSYSFDYMLVEAQVPLRHMIEKQDVPVYVSKIPLLPQGCFSGDMVVTLRAIPREFVQKVADVCVPLEFAHGAPIHIGAPTIIGIEDLQHPAIGDGPIVGEHDVLVFWGCGISATDAIVSAKPHIAVSFSPRCVGSLFITDHKVTDYYKEHSPQHADLSPKVIFLSESPQFASLVSKEAVNQIVERRK
ncbi:hypothetical protein ACROYT_G042805 [Oculina patagonica]